MMFWVKRGLIVPLTLLLFVVLLLALFSIQARSTLLNASYYTKVLAQADFYEFLLTDVTKATVDEARSLNGEFFPGGSTENPLVSLGFSSEAVASSVNTAFPPQWLQSNSEIALNPVVGYVMGQHDEFSFTIQTGDQVEVFASEFKTLLNESDAYDVIFDGFVVPSVAGMIVAVLPVDLNITNDQAEAYVDKVIPREWYVFHVEAAIDEMTPYLVGREDAFRIVIPLNDRADVALQEVKVLLSDANSYENLYLQLVEPSVINSFGDSIQLPYGIVLTKDEVLSGMREVTPPSWIQAQAEQIIDDSAPYFKGEVNGFESEVSIAENKLAAIRIIGETANRKLNEILGNLPQCPSSRSLGEIITQGYAGAIDCLPPNTPVTLVAGLISNQVARAVEDRVLSEIPDSVIITEDDLRVILQQAGFEDGESVLESLRSSISTGLTYTEKDLAKDINLLLLDEAGSEDTPEALEDVRSFLSDGWTYTHTDLREDLFKLDNGRTLQELDESRTIFKSVRLLAWPLILPVILIISGIGYLGGHDWRTRVGWASGSVIAASVLIFLFILALYGLLIEPVLTGVYSDLVAAITDGEGLSIIRSLLREKLAEIIKMISDDFGAGVANKSLITLFVGMVGLGISLGWEYISPLVERSGVQRLMRR